MSLWASQEPQLATCDKQRLLEGDGTWGWDAAAEQFQGVVTLRLGTHPSPQVRGWWLELQGFPGDRRKLYSSGCSSGNSQDHASGMN